MKILKKILLAVLIAVIAIGNFGSSSINAISNLLQYEASVQDLGWLGTVQEGETAGTTSQSKRLEAFSVTLKSGFSGSVEYRAHVAGKGWMDWAKNGEITGTVGEARACQAFQIKLTDNVSTAYDVYYRAYVQNIGWMDWAKNGETAGTLGYGTADYEARMEAMQIITVKKGEPAPGATTDHFHSSTLTLGSTNVTLNKGNTYQLYADDGDNRPISYSCANSTVASVNSSGLVTAKSAGNTVITATRDGATDSVGIQVIDDPAVDIVDKNLILPENPITVYKVQTSDLTDDGKNSLNIEVSKKIWNQKATAATDSTGATVTNGITLNQGSSDKLQGDLVRYPIATIKSDIRFRDFAATSRSVVELKNFKSSDKITVNYPTVGTYKKTNGDLQTIGCKLTISNINAQQTEVNREWYAQNGITQLIDVAYPIFVFSNNLYNGFQNINVQSADYTYTFFDASTSKEIQMDSTLLNVNSLNGPRSDETGEESVSFNADVEKLYLTEDCNLVVKKNESGTWVGGNSDDFDDYIGGGTFQRNSVTAVINGKKSITLRIGTTKSIYNDANNTVKVNNGNMIWATVVTGAVTYSQPPAPVKDVDKSEVMNGDALQYTVSQICNTVGVNATANHYVSFSFEDTLPSQVDYQNCQVLNIATNGTTTDITGEGTISYNPTTRLFTWTASEDYLETMILEGQTLKLIINTVANDTLVDGHVFDNQAFVNINNIRLETNPVSTSERVPSDDNVISITKKIKAGDIWFAHGNPSFIIKLEGKDANGKTHEYYQSITFTEANIIETDANGYASQTVTFANLVDGKYTASEEIVSRYTFGGIVDISDNATIDNETVTFDLTGKDVKSGRATFINVHTRYDKYSHTDIKVNHLK